jgi:hypothetical protein
MSEACVFCDQSWMREAEIFIETPHCIFASTRDPDIRAQAGLAAGVLPGSGAIVPIAHRTTPRKTDGPIHGRPGADGHFGVPGERGTRGQFSSRLLLPIRMRRLQLFPQGALDVGHGLLGSRVGEAARGIPQLAELGGLLMT